MSKNLYNYGTDYKIKEATYMICRSCSFKRIKCISII
nr:MAG TPA: hypothetical protein [Caudoviricetes sp.]